MRKYLPVYLALFSVAAQAQTLNGTVTDAETNQPLEAVVVSVMRDNTTIDYALTDAQGRYALP
ncbi:carboxypeptidase-like regulatory domain-containing protein, partial [Bacteroides heparinolyticus]